MKKRRGESLRWLVVLIPLIFLAIIAVRNFSGASLDDVNPNIPCEEDLLKKSDILYVIPLYERKSIADNKEWCNKILSFNKTLRMHGVYHTYQEFLEDKNSEYLEKGIVEFEKCFGEKPAAFKPPQWKISKNNKKLIKDKMKLITISEAIFHRVYHCSDTGKYSNKAVDLFSLKF